jgi:hypothetical protein
MEVLQMQRNERNGTIVECITDCDEAVVVIGVVVVVVVRVRQPGLCSSLVPQPYVPLQFTHVLFVYNKVALQKFAGGYTAKLRTKQLFSMATD